LRTVGKTDAGEITDEISVAYQTAPWRQPAKLTLAEISRRNDVVTLEARVLDPDGVPCLDAANVVRFGLTGDGRLMDNLGTAGGSRVVQLGNGRAQISLQLNGPAAVASVVSVGLPTAFIKVEMKK
jgi:beta-galactosidase